MTPRGSCGALIPAPSPALSPPPPPLAVHCILQWAMHKAWCPQCKAPFTHLYTHRHLDGTPSDYPLEEGVTLLKRARWFTDELEARERAKEAALGARRLAAADAERRAAAAAAADDGTDRYHSVDGDGPAPPSPRDWCDLYEDMVDAELEEDEAIEDYYFSSAAGRARIVLGNRRWGGGGFMRNGRMYARPVGAGGASGSGAGGAAAGTSAAAAAAPAGGKGKGKAAASSPAAPAPATPSPADGKGKGRVLPAAPAPMPSSNGGRCKPASKEKIPKSAQAQYAWDRDAPASAALGASPLGRSPGSFGAGSCGGGAGAWMAAALGSSPGGAGVGSAPGSGRRAKRNARRAAADAGVALEF